MTKPPTVVLVVGASGVIGQHMRLCRPDGYLIHWHRRTEDELHIGCDLNDQAATRAMLEEIDPDVIVNLAGESNVDTVEKDPAVFDWINSQFPAWLCGWCIKNKKWLVTCSSNAAVDPVNAYGRQKKSVEDRIGSVCTVARPTFVLGVNPFPGWTRPNPIDTMFAYADQVCDRWFSPGIASDIAASLWKLVADRPTGVVNLGIPMMTTRFHLACDLTSETAINGVPHVRFPGAPRPYSTAYESAMTEIKLGGDGISKFDHYDHYHATMRLLQEEFEQRDFMRIEQRAREIAIFLGITEQAALDRLNSGFGTLHNAVSADFRAAQIGDDDAKLLDWYRRTESYIWELSAYHADPGFNYRGMCDGIIQRLKTECASNCIVGAIHDLKTGEITSLDRVNPVRALVLGDGIGDFTLWARQAGLNAVYHDLAGSRTAEFAAVRYRGYTGEDLPMMCSQGWKSEFPENTFDAVVSLDFLEHVTDVAAWVDAIHNTLQPGGIFVCQNAFAMGSGDGGSMPMHLARNDRWEKDWDPLLFSKGFVQMGPQWYRKAVVSAEAVA